MFRRAVCAIPTNSMNKTFANFRQGAEEGPLPGEPPGPLPPAALVPAFPRDDEFRRELKQRDLYNFRSRSYWLRRLENHGRKERVPVDEYTIEHIMPQNEDLSAEWREALGEDWERVHETWLHTLGNLTLTGYNSEYSDHPFSKKRDMQGRLPREPAATKRGPWATGGLERDRDPEPREASGAEGHRGLVGAFSGRLRCSMTTAPRRR